MTIADPCSFTNVLTSTELQDLTANPLRYNEQATIQLDFSASIATCPLEYTCMPSATDLNMCDFISSLDQQSGGQLTILVTDPAVVPPDSQHQIEIMASVVGFPSQFNI